jgi:pyruvate dehydrogenase E2 component (dihydrolipoamide acetyltransferase)
MGDLLEILMPPLGAGVEAGTLVQWLKQPGDSVTSGSVIAIVDTHKATIEVDVPADGDDSGGGIVESVEFSPGDTIPVGAVLAVIRRAAREEEWPADEAVSPVPTPRHVSVSPMAQKLAADLGVDLTLIEGTGPHGSITSEDVQRADTTVKRRSEPSAGSRQAPPPTGRSSKTNGWEALEIQRQIAASLSERTLEIPHHHLSATIDMNAALMWLQNQNERRAVASRLPAIALLIKAVALALRERPELNGFWIDGAFRSGTGIHVGCAIPSRDRGIVAPALLDTDHMDLETLGQNLTDLAARTRSGSLRSSELANSTITVSSMGDDGADLTFGTVQPPQVALVGLGRMSERPWVVSGKIEARPLVTITLSTDARATDPRHGGSFLAALDRLLQKPQVL